VDRTYGLLCSIPHSADAPCYGCVFGAPPPPSLQTSCRDFGILAPVVGTLGTWLAHQVLSLVLGATKTRLAEFNFQTTQVRPLEFSKDPSCPECSETTVRASRGLRAPEVGVLIDVRDPEEFAQSSLPKAQSLPLPTILNSTVDDARIQELRAKAARGIPIYVHCQSGYRAHLAQVHLLKLGISALNLHEPRSRETESCALR
jgi:rhodanese-related sulfurtransferase